MKTLPTLGLIALGAATLTACAASQDSMSPGFGRALALDTRAQISNPDPRYIGRVAPGSDGARVAIAQDHYRTGKVVISPNVAASKVGATGNGAQAGQ